MSTKKKNPRRPAMKQLALPVEPSRRNRQVVSISIASDLIAWADAEAKQRYTSRSRVIEDLLRADIAALKARVPAAVRS